MLRVALIALISCLALEARASFCGYKGFEGIPSNDVSTAGCVCADESMKYKSRTLSNGLKLTLVCGYEARPANYGKGNAGVFYYQGNAVIPVTINVSTHLSTEESDTEYLSYAYEIKSDDEQFLNIRPAEYESMKSVYKLLGNDNRIYNKKSCGTWSTKALLNVQSLEFVDYESDDAGIFPRKYSIVYKSPFHYAQARCK